MNHTCHAFKCGVEVPPALLMCGKHWRLVPEDKKRAVRELYVPGQETKKNPTWWYMLAAQRAIIAVAEIEGLDDHPDFETQLGLLAMFNRRAERSLKDGRSQEVHLRAS